MNKAILTIVEELDFAKMAKENASTQVRLEISKQTFEKLYEYLEVIFETSKNKPKALIDLMEAAKDLECYAIVESVTGFMKEYHSEELANYLQGNETKR